jgi:hypothetical protein
VIKKLKFRRSLTEPPLSEEQVDLIVRKYSHPDVKRQVNYLNFFNDVQSNRNIKSGVQSFQSVKSQMQPVRDFFFLYHWPKIN